MEKSKERELQISLGRITEKNTELVRALNLAVFPVVYQTRFYQDLPGYDAYTRLGMNDSEIVY